MTRGSDDGGSSEDSIFGSPDLDKSIFGSPDLDKSIFGRSMHDHSGFNSTVLDSSQLLSNLFTDELPGAAVTDPSAPVAILRLLRTNSAPIDVALTTGGLVLGRGDDVDVRIKDKSVSRQHLRLDIEGGQIIATDLGSSRGTFIDGVRITAPTPIVIGTTLAVGNQRLELRAANRAALVSPTDQPSSGSASSSSSSSSAPSAPVQPVIDPLSLIPAPTPLDLEDAARASVLFDLEDEDRHALLAATQRLDLEPGTILYKPGADLEHLYIVLNGQLLLHKDGHSAGTVSKGEAIELLGVLRGGQSSFVVGADEPVSVLRIAAATLRAVLARDPKVVRYFEHPLQWPGAARFRQLLRDYGIARPHAIDLVAAMTLRTVPAGTRLATEGDAVGALQIINKGNVSGSKTLDGVSALVSQFGEGSLFGGAELCLEKGHGLSYDAVTDVELIEIDRQVVLDALAGAPELTSLLEAFGVFGQRAAAPAPQTTNEDAPDDDDADAPPLAEFRKKGGKKPLRRWSPRFVRQHDEMDCGAACLAMMSQAYGKKISLATFRAKVHVTREGASMWSLVRAARQTGFEVVGVQCGARALADLHLPAIALTKYHFIVVYKVGKTSVLVGDPAIGLRRIPLGEFKAEFSGMLLLMRPTKKLFEQQNSAPGWRKYLALAPGHIRPAFEIILASLLIFAFGLVTPLLTQATFDRVLVQGDRSLLTIMVIAMSTVAVLSAIMSSIRGYLTGYVANRFDTVFSALVYRYVMRLPLNFFMVRRVGDILTRFREIQNIRQFFTGDALNAVIQVTSITIYIFALFLYSTTLGYLALGLTPVVMFTSLACSRRLRRLMEAGFPAQAKAQGLIVEQLRALETVKSLGAEIAGRWRWDEAFRHSLRTRLRIDKLRVLISAVSVGVEQLALVALSYTAARMAIEGELSIGKVVATGMFASSILGPVRTLAGQWTSLQGVAVGFGRIDDVITTSPEPSHDAPSAGNRRLNGDIELKNVWFQYGSDLSPWVLKDVSLTIKRGETVAFVGRSGSGKTTLVQLLNLLYRPTRGTILIDGKDISTLGLGQVRDSIGIVMQDSHLFAGTVFDNIAFGQDNASLELVMAAARVANAHHFISALKDGYFTRLKEGGGGLSGGQRQRLNLSRALFRRPTILILDEATSALDSESERAVVDAMKVFCRGRTSILIAHRLSTILHADRVVLLDKGRVVESGTHRELIARGGAYAQLFGAQLAL